MLTKDEQDAIPAFILFQGCASTLGFLTANGITKEVFMDATVMDRMQLLRMLAKIAEMVRHLPENFHLEYDQNRLDIFPSMIQAETLYSSDPTHLDAYWKALTEEVPNIMRALERNDDVSRIDAEYERLLSRNTEDWAQPSRKIETEGLAGEIARELAKYIDSRETPLPASGIWFMQSDIDEIGIFVDHDADMLQTDANEIQDTLSHLGKVVMMQEGALHPLSWDVTIPHQKCVWLRGDERPILPFEIYPPAQYRNAGHSHGDGCDCGHEHGHGCDCGHEH